MTKSLLIDDSGRVWPSSSPRIARRVGPACEAAGIAAQAVDRLGFVHVQRTPETLAVSLRPHLVSRLAVVGALDLIVRTHPQRVFVSHGAEADQWEAFTNIDQVLLRIEELADRNCNKTVRPIYECKPQSLDRLASAARGRMTPAMRLWTQMGGKWRPEFHDALAKMRLLDRSAICQAERGNKGFIIRHWGARLNLVGADWIRVAPGRSLEAHPIPGVGHRVVAAYHQAVADNQPRLDQIDMVVGVSDDKIVRRCYDRLVMPWHDAAGEGVVTGVGVSRWTQTLN